MGRTKLKLHAPKELPKFFKESKPGPNVLLKENSTTLVGIQTLPA
jgi:hypothetical protein